MQRDVKKDTDIVEWWQVSNQAFVAHYPKLITVRQNNAQLYPTLARIALDVLPSQASSVPCERLFSGTKQIATDRRASLGSTAFEELTMMKSAWGPELYDMAAWTTAQVQEVSMEVSMFDFEEMLVEDAECLAWDKDHEDWQ